MKRFLKPGESSVSVQDLRSRIKKYYLDQLFLKRLTSMVNKVKALNAPYDEQDRQFREERNRREMLKQQKLKELKEAE